MPNTMRLLAPALLLAITLGAAAPAGNPRVTIDTGTLEGVVDTSGVLAFQGIPYALPPVGALRWRAPRPAASWSGVRPANRLGHNCMQTQIYGDIDPFAAGVSEDCLYLNVWTPSVQGASRPVMVWIHGGGYRAGFGGEERHYGAPLAQKGVVVVTLNYRLGPLGFFAHPALAGESPRHASGNYGLLDQIAALQWVKRNIARFGGDPARVTIFGESAGGTSVGALVASPLAKGLFRGAILESGTGIGRSVQSRDSAEARGVRFAERLGVSGTGADAAGRLRAVSADTLLAASQGTPGYSVALAVDGWSLTSTVDSTLSRGGGNAVATIVGANGDEGDGAGASARTFARLIAGRGKPAYTYLFTRVGDDSANRARGAYHSAEITFVFGRAHPILANAGTTAYDSTLADAMSDYWVAFAATGTPNGKPAAGKRPSWPAYAPSTDAYLELGPEIRSGTFPKRAIYDSLDALARTRGDVRP